jgi:hypothetical protein
MTIKAVYLITLRLDLISEIWLDLPPTGRTLQCLRDGGEDGRIGNYRHSWPSE